MRFPRFEFLRGISGDFELGRVLGAIGGVNYVFWPPVFQAIDTFKNGHWDPAAFCAGYGGGFALTATGIGGFIALKDRSTAAARQTVAQPPLSDKTEQA